jgi:cytochrome P450
VTERRKKPRQDLLSHLVEAEVDGERLSDNEIVNVANLVLLAGHMTSTLLLGNTVLCLDTYAQEGEKVRAEPARMPGVVEEALRFFSPFSAVARSTMEEVEVGGTTIPKDQLLMIWTAAANRDERRFPEPEMFDPARDPNPHLGFGRGIHFCMGAPLARLEVRIALNKLLKRFPKIHTHPDKAPTFMPSPEMAGVRTLPLLANGL